MIAFIGRTGWLKVALSHLRYKQRSKHAHDLRQPWLFPRYLPAPFARSAPVSQPDVLIT